MKNQLGVLLVASAVVAAAANTSAAQDAGLTFDVQFRDTFVTQSPDRLSLGDRIILNDVLLQAGVAVGAMHGVCTVTDIEVGVMLCSIAFILPEGTLSTVFANSPPPEKTFGVFGGTGTYADVTGYAVLVEHGDETGTITFHLSF